MSENEMPAKAETKPKRPRKAPAVPVEPVEDPLRPPHQDEGDRARAGARRVLSKGRPVTVESSKSGGYRQSHDDDLGWQLHLIDAFGTTSSDFAYRELSRLEILSRRNGETNAPRFNAMLAVVDGLRPENEAEAQLAVQMAATHDAVMDALSHLKAAEIMPHITEFANIATKLSRTYAAQMETWAKLRRGGEQKVRVEHVHVHAGAQAIVGNVTHGTGGGGGGAESLPQPHAQAPAALAFAPGVEMRSADPEREAVPVAGGGREEAVPDARRRRGLGGPEG